MADDDDTADGDRWRHHLEAALAAPGETIILGSISAEGSMCIQVACTRAADLVDAARSLLEQATDAVEEELDSLAATDGPRDDARREDLRALLDRLVALTADLADEGEQEGQGA